MDAASDGVSPVVSQLDGLIDSLGGARALAANAFATEMYFFANVADMVQQRERERAARQDTGAKVSASQLAMREIYAEIGAALRLSEFQVTARVNQAHTLAHKFYDTLRDASSGLLSPQHAQTIAEVGGDLDDDTLRGEYERLALDMASELTPSQLRDALESVVNQLDPEGTQERIRQAVARRSVRKRAAGPGVGQLIVTGPAAEIEGAYHRLRDIAAQVQADNEADVAEHAAAEAAREAVEGAGGPSGSGFVADDRTRGQIMADVALDLLLTSAPDGHGTTEQRRTGLGAIRATVNITVPAATLTTAGVGGAQLVGVGAIDDKTARRLAGTSDTWYRFFIDPATGVPVSVDKRHPCTAQKRLLRARDEHCRFPGCRRPAEKCDIDHTIAHQNGGPTALWNLGDFCKRHHTVKHHTDWTVQQLPGGVLRFIAPTRRVHTTRPPGAVRFVPDDVRRATRPPGYADPPVPEGDPAPF
ncbi:HNH endonuclease signature motif containing protein [Microbacterium kribbense]|uniref:HNH endonuclease signature motif containing protein n=1 Tax=Microbacterium kribbense TaxID=433645 RepID=A0ABP7GQB5_9MICO